jgi:hypothetical protein
LEAHQAVECSGRQLVQLFPKFRHFHFHSVSVPSNLFSELEFVLLRTRLASDFLRQFVKNSGNIFTTTTTNTTNTIIPLGRRNHKNIWKNNNNKGTLKEQYVNTIIFGLCNDVVSRGDCVVSNDNMISE